MCVWCNGIENLDLEMEPPSHHHEFGANSEWWPDNEPTVTNEDVGLKGGSLLRTQCPTSVVRTIGVRFKD